MIQMGTFTREEIASYGKGPADDKTAAPADEADEAAEAAADDEVVGDAVAEEVVDDAAAEAASDDADAEVRATRPTAEEAEAVQRDAAEHSMMEENEELPDLSDEPMPDMADADINFDTDRLAERTKSWIQRQARREITAQRLNANIESGIAVAKTRYKDFDAVVTFNPILKANQLHPLAGAAVGASKYVGEMLYYFGRNPDYAKRVAAMPPAQQLLEVGMVKAKIIAEARRRGLAAVARAEGGQRQQTPARKAPARKGPPSREEQLKTSVQDIAKQSRQQKLSSRFYK
jgi:hypothetical protein